MHYANWLGGQSLSGTHLQVAQAAAAGLLYAGIMLTTGSIWPAVLVHGARDSLVAYVTCARAAAATTSASVADAAAQTAGTVLLQGAIYGFEPLYGLLLVYLWYRSNEKTMPG